MHVHTPILTETKNKPYKNPKNNKMKKLFSIVMPLLLLAGFAASAGIAPAVSIPAILAISVFTETTTGVHVAGAIDYTDLATSLGAYYRANDDGIMSQLMLGMDIQDRISVLDGVKDEQPLVHSVTGNLVKPGGDPTSFSATSNAFDLQPRVLKVRPWKIDLTFYPQLMERQWFGYLKANGSDPTELPFAQFFFNEITKKANENIRLSALFAGSYNGAGTAPADIFDGYLEIIADEITATTITPVATGVVSSGTVIGDIEDTYDNLHEAAKAVPGQILVSPTLFDWYVRAYRTAYGSNNDYAGMAKGEVALDGTMYVIKREPGLAGSQRIIATTVENLVYGVDTSGEENAIRVEQNRRAIDVMVDAKAGVQFRDISTRALSVNDQA
jgi:hypothetical protein